MRHAPVTSDELSRIQEIRQMGIVSKDLSHLRTDIAALANDLDMPICALTIVGKHFQHVKVSVGTDLVLTHRDHAFCSHTICQDDVLVVENATIDARFCDNPYVLDGPRIRFYAGAPLRSLEGQKLGAVCLIDDKPNTLTAKGRSRLLEATRVIAAKLFLKEENLRLSQLSISELLHLINSEANFISKERTIALISALYHRWDYEYRTRELGCVTADLNGEIPAEVCS